MSENVKNNNISEEVLKKAEKARAALVSKKSEVAYKKEYDRFQEWLKKNHTGSSSVNKIILLAYFQDMSESYSPNSLWTKWSMLKAMMAIRNSVDTTKFHELEAFLKQRSKGYEPKKSKVLTRDDVVKFLKDASNEAHLLLKVVLIMGYFGGCRSQELLNIKIDDIDDRGSVMVVNIPESKIDTRKQFTIVEEKEFSALSLVRKYMSLRPSGQQRFFLTYRNKRCTVQPVGKNTISKIPSEIASFLGLPNAEAYTGHCLRRTSATALVNAGASMTRLKRHGGWRSSTVAEGYLAESIELKNKTAKMLAGVSDERSAVSTFDCSHTCTSSTSMEKSFNCSDTGNNFSGRFENCSFVFVTSSESRLEGIKNS